MEQSYLYVFLVLIFFDVGMLTVVPTDNYLNKTIDYIASSQPNIAVENILSPVNRTMWTTFASIVSDEVTVLEILPLMFSGTIYKQSTFTIVLCLFTVAFTEAFSRIIIKSKQCSHRPIWIFIYPLSLCSLFLYNSFLPNFILVWTAVGCLIHVLSWIGIKSCCTRRNLNTLTACFISLTTGLCVHVLILSYVFRENIDLIYTHKTQLLNKSHVVDFEYTSRVIDSLIEPTYDTLQFVDSLRYVVLGVMSVVIACILQVVIIQNVKNIQSSANQNNVQIPIINTAIALRSLVFSYLFFSLFFLYFIISSVYKCFKSILCCERSQCCK